MSIHGGTRLDSKQAARAVIFDRRLLSFSIAIAVLGLAAWAGAVSTDYWFVTSCPGGFYLTQTGIPEVPDAYLVSGRAGIWRTCRILFTNASSLPGEAQIITACRFHHLSSRDDLPDDHPLNIAIGYRRTSLVFSVISILLLMLAVFFSWYTLRVPRYTFKRVSGSLYFIVAGVEQVVISLQNEDENMPNVCSWSYSFSFILAWVCFIAHVFCGLAFFYTSSKKKKRTEGHDEFSEIGDDDEPAIMGR